MLHSTAKQSQARQSQVEAKEQSPSQSASSHREVQPVSRGGRNATQGHTTVNNTMRPEKHGQAPPRPARDTTTTKDVRHKTEQKRDEPAQWTPYTPPAETQNKDRQTTQIRNTRYTEAAQRSPYVKTPRTTHQNQDKKQQKRPRRGAAKAAWGQREKMRDGVNQGTRSARNGRFLPRTPPSGSLCAREWLANIESGSRADELRIVRVVSSKKRGAPSHLGHSPEGMMRQKNKSNEPFRTRENVTNERARGERIRQQYPTVLAKWALWCRGVVDDDRHTSARTRGMLCGGPWIELNSSFELTAVCHSTSNGAERHLRRERKQPQQGAPYTIDVSQRFLTLTRWLCRKHGETAVRS